MLFICYLYLSTKKIWRFFETISIWVRLLGGILNRIGQTRDCDIFSLSVRHSKEKKTSFYFLSFFSDETRFWRVENSLNSVLYSPDSVLMTLNRREFDLGFR